MGPPPLCSAPRAPPAPKAPPSAPKRPSAPGAPPAPAALPSAAKRPRGRRAPQALPGASQRSKRGTTLRSLPTLPPSVFGLSQAPPSALRVQAFPCAPRRPHRGASPLRCATRLPRSTAAHLSRRRAGHMMRVPGWVGGFTPPQGLPRLRLNRKTLMNPKPSRHMNI